MSEKEVGWVSIKKVSEAHGVSIELTLNVGSFKDALVVNIDAGDWSQMLASPNLPVAALVKFSPRD